MKYLFTLLILFFFIPSQAQKGFFKVTEAKSNQFVNSIWERADGNIFLVGRSYDETSKVTTIDLNLYDTLGNLIWRKKIGDSTKLNITNTLQVDDANFIIGVTTDVKYLLYFVDTSGHLNQTKSFKTLKSVFNLNSMGFSADSNLYVYTNRLTSTLTRLSRQGDSLSSFTLKYNIDANYIVPTDDTCFVAVQNKAPATSSYLNILKVDTLGNVLWKKAHHFPGDIHVGALIPKYYGYQIAGGTYSGQNNQTVQTFLLRVNQDGELINQKSYDMGFGFSLNNAKDDFSLLISYDYFSQTGFDYHASLLDNNGNLLLTKSYNSGISQPGMACFQSRSGANYYAGNYSKLLTGKDYLLIKIVPGEDEPLAIQNGIVENKTLAYPNPANSWLEFKLKEPAKSIRVYSASGQLALEKELNSNNIRLGTLELKEGIYFYEIAFEDEYITRGKFIIKH